MPLFSLLLRPNIYFPRRPWSRDLRCSACGGNSTNKGSVCLSLSFVEKLNPVLLFSDVSSSQRFVRSAWQQSMQWHPTEKPRGYRPRGCYKRYDRRHRRWMRRACHYNQAGRNRRRRTTTTTTTTSTTPEPPTVPPKSQTKKRCFKRYHKKYKKYVTRCVYW